MVLEILSGEDAAVSIRRPVPKRRGTPALRRGYWCTIGFEPNGNHSVTVYRADNTYVYSVHFSNPVDMYRTFRETLVKLAHVPGQTQKVMRGCATKLMDLDIAGVGLGK